VAAPSLRSPHFPGNFRAHRGIDLLVGFIGGS
jgi:hypothetical protein